MTPGEQHKAQSAWQAVGRPIAAYWAACYVAAIVLLLVSPLTAVGSFDIWPLESLLLVSLYLSAAIALLTCFPALFAAGIIINTRIPRGIGEIGAGAVLGPAILWLLAGLGLNTVEVWLFASVTAAGASAGLVYWLLVGRPTNPNRR